MADEQTVYDTTHPAYLRWQDTAGASGMDTSWVSHLQKDPNGSKIVMTIELVIGNSTTLMIATDHIQVTSSTTGKSYSYQPLLAEEPSIEKSISVGSASSSVRTIQLQIPNKLVNVGEIIRSGHMIAGLGEVSLQVDGGDYDKRFVLIRGASDDGVQFGPQEGGMIQLAVSDPKETCDLRCAPYEVSDATWPKASSNAIGNRYPVLLNSFSKIPALLVHYDDTTTPATSRYLVCLGVEATIAASGAVWLDGDNTTPFASTYRYAVERWTDGKGIGVTLIDMTGQTGPPPYGTPNADASIFVKATTEDARDSVIAAIEYMLERFSGLSRDGIDYRLMGKAEAELGGLRVNGCVNASGTSNATNSIQFIEGELLASFPMVSMIWNNGKYGPVVVDRRRGYHAANLIVGAYPLYDRISDVQETPKSSLLNSFTLRYGYDPLEDNYVKARTIDYTNSALCQLSQMQVGVRVGSPIDSLLIVDDDTAAYVIEWMVDHMSLPSYYVEYSGSIWMYFNLDVGDNIKLTDGEFGWEEEVATVEKITYSRGECTIGLRVWWRYCDLSGAATTIFSYVEPEPLELDPPQ